MQFWYQRNETEDLVRVGFFKYRLQITCGLEIICERDMLDAISRNKW